MILSDKNCEITISYYLGPGHHTWLAALRLYLAKKSVGCRGPDFGYFRYRG